MDDTQTPPRPISQRLLRLVAPFAHDRTLRGDDIRQRAALAIMASAGGPLLLFYGVQNLLNEQSMFALLSGACGAALLWCLIAVRRSSGRNSARVAVVGIIALLCVAMYIPNDRLTMNWVTIMPLLLTFLFGLREGLLWTAFLFLAFLGTILGADWFGGAPALAQWPNTYQLLDFSIAYVVVTICVCGYDSLRLYANRVARTRRKRLEAALEDRRRSEEQLLDFAEAASDLMFELDRDLRITRLLGRWETFMGVPAEQAIGRYPIEETGNWTPLDADLLTARLRAHEPFRDVHLEMRAPGGERMHLNLRAQPLFDERGAFAGYRGVGTDITARIEAELELQEKSRALQQASKMEAVGQLTSGVAHDFNNLLTVIMGNLELVDMQLEDADMHLPEVDEARAASARAADLTNKLLAFSRRQSLSPERVAVDELLIGTARLLTRTLPESIRVRTACPADIWASEVDRSQLENALLNLALNARDAITGNGELELAADNLELDDEQASAYQLSAGEYVRIKVRDSGSGIPKEMIDHVFEPFFSTKPAGQGTGLGLSMVYGFVRQTGGGVRISSELEIGTTVELLLPRCLRVAAPAHTVRKRPDRRGDGRQVLVIEDELAVRELVVSMLTRLGYRATAAATGEAGVAAFERERPDLVISDVVLAGNMTGVDAIRAIRRLQADVPALFMSGYSESVFEDQPELPENVGLLAKPFGIADLEARLRAVDVRDPDTH